MTAEDGTVHPGSYCAPVGATGKTKADTAMVCSVGEAGGRARWRRNGPAPARSSRRRGRKSTATGGTLPVVNAGIDPNRTAAPVPAPAAEQQPPTPAKPQVLNCPHCPHTAQVSAEDPDASQDEMRLHIRNEHPPVAPAPAQPAATAAPVVDGHLTDRQPAPNEWGSIPRPGAHCVHFDGPLVRDVEMLGPDSRIDMGGGEPLADTVLNLADQVRGRRLHPSELPDQLRAVQARLPEGSNAHRKLGNMIADVDAPMTPAPVLPAGTPEPLRQLATELHRIPICRRDSDRELDRVVDMANRLATGRLQPRDLEVELKRINRHEMWSDTGSIQINEAIRGTADTLRRDRMARRAAGT